MTPEELVNRQARAEKETFVIARTEEGFRIHNPTNGGHVYYVTGTPEEPACSCPDFEHHAGDPEWRCKHILAVLLRYRGGESAQESETPEREQIKVPDEAHSRMVLKRSVSPDGKIDALSVEFSIPINGTTDEETHARATQAIQLQDRIARGFLQSNGRENGPKPTLRQDTSNQAQPAIIIEVGGADGRWGRRLFLVFQVNGRRLRLYGSQKKLDEAIRYAGFPEAAQDLEEGTRLNLPCQVVTQPTEDGKYLNVVRVLPAQTQRDVARW